MKDNMFNRSSSFNRPRNIIFFIMEDFCRIKGSLVDLKLLLEINGYVPFVWKQDSNLESFEPKLIEKFIRELKNDGIKLICYNYKAEKFEIEDLYYDQYYWDRDALPDNVKHSKRAIIMHRVFTLKTSDEDIYFHKINESISKKNYKKILDLLRLSTVGNRGLLHEGVPDTFHQFDPFVEFPTTSDITPDLCPVMYYIKMS